MNHSGSLLVSQIGYEAGHSVRLIVRGATPPGGNWTLTGGGEVWRGMLPEARSCWGDTWRVLSPDAPLAAGIYNISMEWPGHTSALSVEFEVAPDILWERTWRAVSYEQAERRQRFSQKHQGQPLGWFDAGMHWQEANAHAAYLVGLCDVVRHRGSLLSGEERERLIRQLLNGGDYLALLQDMGESQLNEPGPLVHQSFKIEHLILPTDAPRAAVAWARVAELLPSDNHERAAEYRERARRALRWFLQKPRHLDQPGCGIPHGLTAEWTRPDEFSTPDIAQCVDAALLLDEPVVFDLAAQWLQRQIPQGHAAEYDGLFGHFQLFSSGALTEKAWTHGFDPQGYGFNCGQTLGHHLTPLIALLRRHPNHPQAALWRRALEDYAYGYFLPACLRNPFHLAPLGWFEGQGLLHFAGLWHGCNGLYGRMAAQALEFAIYLRDRAFFPVAGGNLLWIAGLNSGLRQDHLYACHLSSPEAPADEFIPVSMIHGIGRRTAGSWLNLRGAICNGFGTGDQFVWDTAVDVASDGPRSFSDEDWITHAGGWLSGIARWSCATQTL
jgi:hypothetical protein